MQITDFQTLWRAVNRIKIDVIARTEVEQFEKEGLDTDLSDIFSNERGELFTVLKNGTIRKVIVHICDISNYQEEWSLPKFHIMECTTLDDMRRNHRMYRYKKASRLDGEFWIIKGNFRKYEKLNICRRDCLQQYNNTYDDDATIETFNIQKYMEEPMKHSRPYITDELDITAIPKRYDKHWKKISKERKEYCKWICQECFRDFSQQKLREYLHTHHIDADPANNKYENLKVLCIECHAKEFQHAHIKNTPQYEKFLKIQNSHAS